jgi:hypothetical protein
VRWSSTLGRAIAHVTARGQAPTVAPSDAQRAAFEQLQKSHPCRVCGEAHPFTCPYIARATLNREGSIVTLELRDEFFRDYVRQIPHSAADMEVEP